jgi:hypothetical protein
MDVRSVLDSILCRFPPDRNFIQVDSVTGFITGFVIMARYRRKQTQCPKKRVYRKEGKKAVEHLIENRLYLRETVDTD